MKTPIGLRGLALPVVLMAGVFCALWNARGCPPLPALVAVTATDPTASEVGPNTGTFRVTRTGGNLNLPLTIYYTLSGTAVNGTDYQTLSGWVQIQGGATWANVTVTPILDLNSSEGNETVVLTVTDNAYYDPGTPSSATVTIADVPPDSDSDDLSDAWEWWHFGSLSQGAFDDYDQDNADNLTEYNAGSDPNTLLFDVQFNNLRVNANTANGTFNVVKGVPAKMAVLMDNTNFASATWLPFSANLSVSLGSPDARHAVWIGLKGRATTSDATWSAWPLMRDTAAPVIVITNPAVTTLSQPILQLQGYSPEPLLSLRYDVTNAAGSLTNAEGYVTTQWFDTNLFELTTNWFECVDIQLTNGDNTITLRATDLAGNVATNVYTYVLDYTGDTTAPALTVYWPQDGTRISGNTFTFRGWLDDATASVTAQIVDASDVTNVVSGLLERDGLLWVEDLPLSAGASTLTLKMTDAANNVSTTNLTVLQSDVLLAVDDLSGMDVNQPRTTVTGTINVSDRKIWVNGMEVTNVSGGVWWVEGVPVPDGGTAVVQARAIANSDNGGNGSGGNGGSGATMQDSGNPTSPTAVDQNPQANKQPEIVEIQYCKDWEFDSEDVLVPHVEHHDTQNIRWDLNQPGSWTWTQCYGADPTYYYWWGDMQWGTNGVGTGTGGSSSTWEVGGGCGVKIPAGTYPYTAPTAWVGEYCEGGDVRFYISEDVFILSLQTVTRSAQTRYELHTGGKKVVSGQKNLFVLSASAERHMDMFYPEIDDYPEASSIAPTLIQLGDLGKLGSDAVLYKALGDGETHDVTPTVAGSKYYRFDQPGMSKHKLVHLTQCTALSNPDNARASLGVGEYVNFAFEPPVDMTFPETPWWIASEGSIDPATGSGTLFTAPSNAANAMVRVFVRDTQLDTSFSVKEPTGYAKPPTHLMQTVSMTPSATRAGAYMKNWVYIAPTDVSFCRIQVKEASGGPSSRDGYFETFPPLMPWHNANFWWNVNENNRWSPYPDTAGGDFNIPESGEWIPGSFTWHIPVYWTIGAPNGQPDIDPETGLSWPSTLMTHWDQVFELDSAGKWTVIKFDVTVSRTLDDHYEHSEAPNPNP